MSPISRIVPWLLVTITVGVLAFAAASLVAMESDRPELIALPEQVSSLYFLAVPLTFGLVAALVIRSQPRHPEGWIFGLFALLTAVSQVLEVYTRWHPQNETLARFHGTVQAPLFGLLALALLLFPDGRPPSSRWRPVVAFTCLVTVLGALMEAGGSTLPWVGPTESALSFVMPLALLVLGVLSLWIRWRHATGLARQQVKWLAFAASVFSIELALGFLLALTDVGSEDAGSYYIGDAIFVITVCLIPVAMGIGIVRHHLYDVDKLIGRTIAYGLLLVAAALLYLVSLAVFAGVLASRNSSPVVLAVATTAVAVAALDPFRRRLVGWADRRVYGARTEPGEMMAGVAAELAAYRSPEDGLTGLAEAARRATRARGAFVRIELPDDPGHVVPAGDVSAAGARPSVPMRVDGVAIGSITVVDPSRHSEGLKLLSRLAALAAPAAVDMRTLTELRHLRSRILAGNAELVASRARLARAEEAERAHLGHFVRSEVLPAVLDLQHALPAPEAIRVGDVHGMDLTDAALRSRELAERIRGLAHSVLPPVLLDRGLAAALRAYVRRLSADVTLDVRESRRLPGSMEEALYACGRLLVDAVGATSGPVTLTLTVSAEDVRLAVTAPGKGNDVDDNLRPDALRLLGDRLGVLGGTLMTASSVRITEITCHVPLTAESRGAAVPALQLLSPGPGPVDPRLDGDRTHRAGIRTRMR
jgi:hypothetical protein